MEEICESCTLRSATEGVAANSENNIKTSLFVSVTIWMKRGHCSLIYVDTGNMLFVQYNTVNSEKRNGSTQEIMKLRKEK
jgi:hypothetical protein